MDTNKMLSKTMDIIKKYYTHSERYPVLKHKTPEQLKKEIDITIPKK